MSHPCGVDGCKRISRALCHCCNQNLCRDHLNDHDDQLNNRLNPFADQLNYLSDQLSHINVSSASGNAHERLNDWRMNAHKTIERYFEQKKIEFDQYINSNMSSQQNEINRLKKRVHELIQKQEATLEEINLISSDMQNLQNHINQLEYKHMDININALRIEKDLIRLEANSYNENFDLSSLNSPFHTISRAPESSKALAGNNQVILLYHENQLCLLNRDFYTIKSVPWSNGWIWDMCWSSTLSIFFILTLYEVYMIDPDTMVIQRMETKEKYAYCSFTCSDTSFYITTNELGSAICEYSLLPTIDLINKCQHVDLCKVDEIIHDIVYHRGSLAFIVENETSHTKRMDLRVAQTLERIWVLDFDTIDPLHNPFRLCLFNYNEWLVVDWKGSQIFHVTKDGKQKSKCVYEFVPFRCCEFYSNILIVSCKNSISFCKI